MSAGLWVAALVGAAGLTELGGCGSSGTSAAREDSSRPECRWGREARGADWQSPAMWGSGGSWASVFSSPGASVDPKLAPEYSRNNDALGYRQDGPVLASNEWPQPDRPDLYYSRTIQLQTRPDQVQFFDYGSRYYSGGGWSGPGGYSSTGTWGFWR